MTANDIEKRRSALDNSLRAVLPLAFVPSRTIVTLVEATDGVVFAIPNAAKQKTYNNLKEASVSGALTESTDKLFQEKTIDMLPRYICCMPHKTEFRVIKQGGRTSVTPIYKDKETEREFKRNLCYLECISMMLINEEL